MKNTLKNRPRYDDLDSVGGMYPYEVQMFGKAVDEWFEGFEKELRERLNELKNVKGRIPLHAKCHMAGEVETIEEILGEEEKRR